MPYVFGQQTDIIRRADSLLTAEAQKPFNGVVLIAKEGKLVYQKVHGFSDLARMTPLQATTEFVVDMPIRNYLPHLQQGWSDTVNIHHLLTHTHGITSLDKAVAFSPGEKFLYPQLGYELLAKILEKTTGELFAALSTALFKRCKMKNTYHPALNKHKNSQRV